MANSDKVSNFIARISEKAKRIGGGKVEIDSTFIRKLVAEDPETAAAVVWGYCQMARNNPVFFQMALLVATAYLVEFDDDSLVLEVNQEMGQENESMPPIQVQSGDINSQDILSQNSCEPIRALQVMPYDLMKCNIRNFTRLFSVEGADKKKLSELTLLLGKLTFTFPVDDDPRVITKIPEVRKFIQKLHNEMPFFPIFLDFRPELSMFFMYFGCLADQSALDSDGIHVNLTHYSVIMRVFETLEAIGKIAKKLNQDPTPIWRAILSAYPRDIADQILNDINNH